MNDEFSKTVERMKRIQAMALDNPELIELATLFAELHCRKMEDEIRYLQQADPISLANAYYAQLNEEQAQDAIDAARRGNRSHIEERAEAGLTMPAEKPFLFGKKVMGRPPTIRMRDEWIVATIEALRASGLKKTTAIAKAGRAWGKHLNLTRVYSRGHLQNE